MELVVALWLLTALQCTGWLARGAVLFVRPLRSWIATRGPGWRISPPIPSLANVRTARFPLIERDGVLQLRGGASWRASQGVAQQQEIVTPGDLAQTKARGERVVLGNRAVFAAASAEEAEALATVLRSTPATATEERVDRITSLFALGLSRTAFEERRKRALAGTRWLGRIADLYAVCLLAGLPAALGWFTVERGLAIAGPALAGLHLATLAALAFAHAALWPGKVGERMEILFSSLLYPPLLLHSRDSLVRRAVGSFHPAVAAIGLLDERDARDFLRTELLRLRVEDTGGPIGLTRLEQRAFDAFLTESGLSATELLAAPERRDPLAQSYCPACRSEYRRDTGACADCGAQVIAFEA